MLWGIIESARSKRGGETARSLHKNDPKRPRDRLIVMSKLLFAKIRGIILFHLYSKTS